MVGFFLVIGGLAVVLVRQELAGLLFGQGVHGQGSREERIAAYILLVGGTALGIAGMLVVALSVER